MFGIMWLGRSVCPCLHSNMMTDAVAVWPRVCDANEVASSDVGILWTSLPPTGDAQGVVGSPRPALPGQGLPSPPLSPLYFQLLSRTVSLTKI